MRAKALVITSYELSVPVGTIQVLRRILDHTRPGDYAVVARSGGSLATMGPMKNPIPSMTIPVPKADWRGENWMDLASVVSGLPYVLAAIHRFRPASLLAVYPFEGCLALALAAHRITGLPLAALFGDLYLENREPGQWRHTLAVPLQKSLFRQIRAFGVLNQAMSNFYKEHYGLDPVVLPSPVGTWPRHVGPRPLPDSSSPRIIGYSGSINADREEGLQRLLQVVGNRSDYELRLFSSASREYLQSKGIWADNVRLAFHNNEQELVEALAQCHLLYVPLAFHAYRREEQMRTCLGSKISDYLTTGVPILSHSPSGYWHAEFFRQYGCGYVVDTPDVGLLGQAVERLCSDTALRNSLVSRGFEVARSWSGPNVAKAWDLLVDRACSSAQPTTSSDSCIPPIR